MAATTGADGRGARRSGWSEKLSASTGEGAALDVGDVGVDRGADAGGQLLVGAHEARLERVVHAQQVVDDQHLAVAADARADADGGDGELPGDALGDLGRDALEHHRVGAGVLERAGVGDQPLGAAVLATLDLEAAQLVERLRGQADVTHDRDAARHQAPDQLGVLGAALELDRVSAALLDQASGRGQGRLDAGLVRHERHVADHVSPVRAARHRAGVIDDLVEGDRQGGLVALDDHAQRVADQEQVGVALVEQTREGRVVAGQHGDLLAAPLHLAQGVDGDP